MKKNILVFPCGSEVALEVYNSVKYSTHFHLIGASSVSDHGEYVFDDYIGDLPFVGDIKLIEALSEIVRKKNIAAIYPAMDSAITFLKKNEKEIGCPVISSPLETVNICLSKKRTYNKLEGIVHVPKIYSDPINDVPSFPVFGKPEIGYGSKGTSIIKNSSELSMYLQQNPESLILEYLPGKEYTIDCFSDCNGKLLYSDARERQRIKSGISVRTSSVEQQNTFTELANNINNAMKFKGAWFFQVKLDKENRPTLLEVASRLGGSSSLSRMKGVNFALLSIFTELGVEVKIIVNDYKVQHDRALSSRYKLDINYDSVYFDYDDCLILDGKTVNTTLLAFIFECKNKGIKTYLLTKHEGNLTKEMEDFGINGIFDKILHIEQSQNKADYIEPKNAIFIDDSFQERSDVQSKCNIPTFSPDMVCALMTNGV